MIRQFEHVEQLERDWTTRGYSVLRGVPLSPEYFQAPGRGADLLFKPLDSGDRCAVLVEAGVRYLGADPALLEAFASPTHNGWRALCVLRPATPETVLSGARAALGLDGSPPQLMPSALRMVVPGDPDHAPGPRPAPRSATELAVNLVEEARSGRLFPALFRERETEALLRILLKEGKNAACLIGEAGVGKTKVVENLAVRIVRGDVPPTFAQARILEVNLSYLAAGASFQNQVEGRLKEILDLARADRNVVLFLDELHTICSPTHQAAQLIKPDLGRGRVRCIGATTNTDYRVIEEDVALARRFQPVPVLELTPGQTLEVLREHRGRLQAHHGVAIDDSLLDSAIDLSVRHVPGRRLPDKAIDLLDEACALARMRSDNHGTGHEATSAGGPA